MSSTRQVTDQHLIRAFVSSVFATPKTCKQRIAMEITKRIIFDEYFDRHKN